MDTNGKCSRSLASCIAAYAFIVGIGLLEILIAYQNIDGSQRFLRFLLLATAQAAVAILTFMSMKIEKRSPAIFLLSAIMFLLVMMNMFWSDSFRLLNMRPFAR